MIGPDARLAAVLAAFIAEHEYCGALDAGVDDERVCMTSHVRGGDQSAARGAGEGGRMMAEELPPTGWMQRPEAFEAAFLRHHEKELSSYIAAVTQQLYQGASLVLPYHYDVLAIARQFLATDKDDVAVIMAQTACEIATDDSITALLRHQNLPTPLESWINDRIERTTTLKNEPLYQLYRALSGDDLKQSAKALWGAYVRRADLRNGIVHAGAHATKAQAVEACDTALDLIHHFETVRARVIK